MLVPTFLCLQHLYPELGVELPERHYGTDCRLWVPGEGVNWKVRCAPCCSTSCSRTPASAAPLGCS